MPNFLYTGINDQKKKISGSLVATNHEVAVEKLEKMGVGDCDIYETMTSLNSKVRYRELAIFSKQMATLYKTNISLLEGLLLIKEQVINKQLQIAILEIHKLIHDGYTLATAVSMYGHIFGDYFINIVSIAEVSGTLEDSFKELYEFYRDRDTISRKIKNMLIYPGILSTILIFLVGFVIVKVMPIFNKMLIDYGIEMPGFTKAIINISIWINNNIVMLLFGIILLIGGATFYFRTAKGSKFFKKFVYKYLFFNKIEAKIITINFSKSVATLLRSGVILSNAIELSNSLVKDTNYYDKFEVMKEKVMSGENFYYAIQELGVYPSFYAKMLSIGNDVGALDTAFIEVAAMIENDLQEEIEHLQKFFEPIIMLFLGGVVALILISVALPMINILENIV